ncbi:MAG: ankyrin repeat domain-containing protein [Ruminococcus sp.]|nr:ankyrin repeat domain-containing protein [Ruminococcus sp.]
MSYNLGRDEIFWRLGHEKSDELLDELNHLENVNFQDEQGISYLEVACINHYLEAVKILLKNGADPNLTDKYGRNPIIFTLGIKNANNTKILETFLKYGLDLNMPHGNSTLKEFIESFEEDEWNILIKKYEN